MGGLLGVLGIERGDVVSVVGAGGKTTLVYQLAAEAAEVGWSALVTTTTHMGTLPEAVTGPVVVEADGSVDEEVRRGLQSGGRVTLLGRRVRPDKLEGIAPARVDSLARSADLVIVEADGARGRSLKVPADHEPVLPGSTRLLVVLAALDALGRELDERTVHRVERVREVLGGAAGGALNAAAIAAALAWPAGYPARRHGARLAAFLNKAEGAERLEAAAEIATGLKPPYDCVAAGSARSGTAQRFG